MSIRWKITCIIIAIVLVITASTLGVGLFISRYRFMETVKETLSSMSAVSAGMLSAKIGWLQDESEFVAKHIGMGHQGDAEAIEQQLKLSPHFVAFTVFEREGYSVLSAGNPDARPPLRARESDYAQRAFNGETVITTTMYSSGGDLVMHIWTPIDNKRVLIATLPGMYLSNFISSYRVWKTGSIFILDNEGVLIAGGVDFRVRERHNYVEWGKRDPEYRKIGKVFQEIIENKEGLTQYPLNGQERLCAYDSIEGTDQWSVGVAAPLSESPLSQIQQMLLLFSAVFLGLGLLSALSAANNIAVPYEKMMELQKSAETASESKTRFLANMSHEMRTPLNAIIGLSELELGMAHLEGDSFINVEKIYSAGMTLLGIINDLLDISKIESGKLTLVPVVYDVPSMINDTINLNLVRIGSKHIQFRLHLDPSTPSQLKGDELRVKQIFNNLLSNAFKYTDAGFVDWTLSFIREGHRVKVISTVKDTGIGIKQEDQAKIFKDYYQANLKAHYYVEGTGLGLSITKNLVKLMGGSVSLNSEYGKGSTFMAEFYQISSGEEVIGEDAAQNLSQFRFSAQRRSRNEKLIRADMSYATVLVVDDVVTNLDVTRGMLKPYGIAVDCVTSGMEAIRRVRDAKVRYNAIFMDHMMPGMDGIEAVRFIRSEIGSDYSKTVPIIALTANALLGNESLFLENGFQAFLSKPIDILRLNNILNQWVRQKKYDKERLSPPVSELPQKEGESIFKDADIPGLNVAAALGRLDNDGQSYLRVLKSFVTHTPNSIKVIKTVQGAADAQSAADFPFDAYRVAIHSIKGASRGIGAEKIGDEAEALEKAAVKGDAAFITACNSRFAESVEELICTIDNFIKMVHDDDDAGKPEKDAPDRETIAAIRQACEHYDMDALKKAIDDLSAFHYKTQPDLADWMREQAGKSNFQTIQNRVESLWDN